METSLDHLTEHVAAEPEATTLEQITEYAMILQNKREELAEIEADVKDKKAVINKLEQELLPEAMLAVGLTEFKLASGKKVSLKEELSCSVKDYSLLGTFLEERGDDALLKSTIEVGKLPDNIVGMILNDLKDKYDIDGTSKTYIHPSTLKAYFKRVCGVGSDVPADVPIAELNEEMVNTFTYYKTTISKK